MKNTSRMTIERTEIERIFVQVQQLCYARARADRPSLSLDRDIETALAELARLTRQRRKTEDKG